MLREGSFAIFIGLAKDGRSIKALFERSAHHRPHDDCDFFCLTEKELYRRITDLQEKGVNPQETYKAISAFKQVFFKRRDKNFDCLDLNT